jgi:EAL domain-containing protein (putative c-di-GMP-specific phosphodiesterase class I)
MSWRVLAAMSSPLRWNHPQRGLVPPLEFIPVAEETRVIIDLGAWVLREAVRQATPWFADSDDTFSRLGVNVSSRQFYGGFDGAFLAEVLAGSGFPAERLVFEITESLLLGEDDRVSSILSDFRDMGVGIVVDDFGTGYSALSYLRRFPVTALKIDRAFTREMETNSDDARLVESIIAMARALGITVVAEGVETEGQAAMLGEMGCAFVQGYLYGRPIDADRFQARHLCPKEPVT